MTLVKFLRFVYYDQQLYLPLYLSVPLGSFSEGEGPVWEFTILGFWAKPAKSDSGRSNVNFLSPLTCTY